MGGTAKHYDSLLAEHYTWLFGGMEEQLERNTAFFKKHGIQPELSCVAIDLGAGSGFQSIPLARAGFKVVAVDTCEKLLEELRQSSKGLDIEIIRDDILNLPKFFPDKAELAVCMGDTLSHLASVDDAKFLFSAVHSALENGGRFVITFRDSSVELKDEERFIPVRSEEGRIFTCFLEYGKEHIRVHDLIYVKREAGWKLLKSSYKKIRISLESVLDELSNAGFTVERSLDDGGLRAVIAAKR